MLLGILILGAVVPGLGGRHVRELGDGDALGGNSFRDLVFTVEGEERHGVGGACRGRLRSVTVEFCGISRLVVDEDHIGWHRGIPVWIEGGEACRVDARGCSHRLALTGRQRRCAGAAAADPRTPPSTTSSIPWM